MSSRRLDKVYKFSGMLLLMLASEYFEESACRSVLGVSPGYLKCKCVLLENKNV